MHPWEKFVLFMCHWKKGKKRRLRGGKREQAREQKERYKNRIEATT